MSDLRKLAEDATPGPWVNSRKGIGPRCVSEGQDDGMTLTRIYTDFPNDAAFLAAASPDVVLGLLDRIEELEAANRACVDTVAEWGAKAGGLQAEVDRVTGCLSRAETSCDHFRSRMHDALTERDEAHAAVRRLAGVVRRWVDEDDDTDWDALEDAAKEALADPVVKIVMEHSNG